jgi:hypothetical protein
MGNGFFVGAFRFQRNALSQSLAPSFSQDLFGFAKVRKNPCLKPDGNHCTAPEDNPGIGAKKSPGVSPGTVNLFRSLVVLLPGIGFQAAP